MIVKGIIQSINYTDNTCIVRMPVFESAGSDTYAESPATFAINPGIYNGYSSGDVVYVGFENNKIDLPIILGKLYLGAEKESKNSTSCGNLNSLSVKNSATIPINTTLTRSKNEANIDIFNNINTIGDIVKAIKQSTTTAELGKKFSTTEKLIGEWLDGKPLYRKTYTITDNISQNTNWGPKEIDLKPLEYDTIMVDLIHTLQIGDKYSLNEYNAPAGDYFNTYIDLQNKKLYYRGQTPHQETVKKFIITIEYTKK